MRQRRENADGFGAAVINNFLILARSFYSLMRM